MESSTSTSFSPFRLQRKHRRLNDDDSARSIWTKNDAIRKGDDICRPRVEKIPLKMDENVWTVMEKCDWNSDTERTSESIDFLERKRNSRCTKVIPMKKFSASVILMVLVCFLALLDDVKAEAESVPWSPRKGCHKVGHRRTINIPGCDRVEVLLNACRGQCLSWAVPSPESVVASPKFRHKVTSYSHCCRMTEHEEVTYLIRCEEGIRELRFPSASKCDCFDCSHHAV